MYRGSIPTSTAKQQTPPTSTAMLVSMSRPPNLPSHSGPPHSYSPYTIPHALHARPEIVTPSHQVRSRDPIGSQNHAQQLPSLRTLLEPELLDKKLSDSPLQSGAPQISRGNYTRYGSNSPTLKRRHEVAGYPHGYPKHNTVASQTSFLHRQHPSAVNTDPKSGASSTLGSTFANTPLGLERGNTFAYPSHQDPVGKNLRIVSTTSDPTAAFINQPIDDELGDAGRPIRRRLDGTSRAPIRSSRCIGQREIPGEGLCYIYEDGTYCRVIIDGEPVNPSWGITKAGKPRKRLAQACLTCREKKIKCEPGYPKCHQCAKSQRVCRG